MIRSLSNSVGLCCEGSVDFHYLQDLSLECHFNTIEAVL